MEHKISEVINEYLVNEPAPPEVHNRAITFQVVVYTDGTSAIDYYWRLDSGELIYDGRVYNDEQETAELMSQKLFRRQWEAAKKG